MSEERWTMALAFVLSVSLISLTFALTCAARNYKEPARVVRD